MYKLLIKNADGVFETADFGKDTPYFTFAVNDVAATEDAQANYSQRLALPFTPTNNRLMGYLNAPQSGAKNAYNYAECRLYCDGLQMVGEGGVLYLLDCTDDSYEVQVLSGVADLFTELEKVDFESGFAELGEPVMPTNSIVTPVRGLEKLNAETLAGDTNWLWAEHTIGFNNTSNTGVVNGLYTRLYPLVWLSTGDNTLGLLPALLNKIGWSFEFSDGIDTDKLAPYAWSIKEPLKPTTWNDPNQVNVFRWIGKKTSYQQPNRDIPVAVEVKAAPFDFDGVEAVAVRVFAYTDIDYGLFCECVRAQIGYMSYNDNPACYDIGIKVDGVTGYDYYHAYYLGFWTAQNNLYNYYKLLIFRADGKVYETSTKGAEYGSSVNKKLQFLDETELNSANRLLEGYTFTLDDNIVQDLRNDLIQDKGKSESEADQIIADLQVPTLKLLDDYDTGQSTFGSDDGKVTLSLMRDEGSFDIAMKLQPMHLIFNDADSDTAVCGSAISLARSLGFSTGVDALKAILQYYGLICECNNGQKVVTFHQLAELYDRKGEAVDWSDKLVAGSATRTYALDGYAQSNKISLKENKALEWSAGTTIECPVAVIDKEQDLFTIGLQGGKGHDIAFFKLDDEKVKSQKLNAPQVEVISDTGIQPSKYNKWLVKGADVANYEADLLDNYNGLVQMLERPLTIVATFNLTTADAVTLDFFKPIYLRQFGRYFYLNEVSNWHKGAVTECTLVAL